MDMIIWPDPSLRYKSEMHAALLKTLTNPGFDIQAATQPSLSYQSGRTDRDRLISDFTVWHVATHKCTLSVSDPKKSENAHAKPVTVCVWRN